MVCHMEKNLQTSAELSLFEQSRYKSLLPRFSIFFKGITDIYPTGERDLITLAEEIRSRTLLRQKTEKLRSIPDEKERADYKKTFPYVTFSGTFRKRSNEELINHSGYICIDLDHIGDAAGIGVIQGQILKSFTPALMFISPSGDGLKIVFKIDISQGTHAEYFSALKHYIKSEINLEVDPSGKDVSRACFICHDLEVFYSESSNSLNRSFIDTFNIIERSSQGNNTGQISDPDIIYQRCKTWLDKCEQFTAGNRNRYITKFAGVLNRYGVPEHFTLIELSKFSENGFTQHEIESTVKSIYRNDSFHGIAKFGEDTTFIFNNLPQDEVVKRDVLFTTPLLPIEGLPSGINLSIMKTSTLCFASSSAKGITSS